VSWFRGEAAFARYAGGGILPHWSGPTAVRLGAARSGNRQLNAAVYRITMNPIRCIGPGGAYYRILQTARAVRRGAGFI
jgi:hypothetical protein